MDPDIADWSGENIMDSDIADWSGENMETWTLTLLIGLVKIWKHGPWHC
jgi:hypothetical protein